MRLVAELLRLSATDLANHLGCGHLSRLELAVAEGRARRPHRNDPIVDLLMERGREHEAGYLKHLRAQKLGVVEIRTAPGADNFEATLAAMRDGADVIYQAPLGDDRWYGRADFLRKVAGESELGAWSYEVTDAKLATETRAGTILQLCVYSTLLERLQGRAPQQAHVVAPHHKFVPESYRLDDYSAYYRLVKHRLETALEARDAITYPEPAQHCDVCNWWKECNARRRADDHLCFVAGISRLQIKELRTRLDVETLERLGELKVVPKPTRGSRDALERARDQAAIQLKARRLQTRQHEVLPLGREHGFFRLPAPSRGDLFLDLEGDRLALDGGREYLFGISDARGSYTPLWAANPAEEKRAFERVVDRILAAFEDDRAMHVYHFGAYEPTAFKRLSGRYATRENELDVILRAELFVDLHTIVKHSLRASVETYSLKDLEQFYGLARTQDLRVATASRRAIEWAIEMRADLGLDAAPRAAAKPQLELGLDAEPSENKFAEHIAIVERYNRDDCVSAARLRDWLEELRVAAEREWGGELERPELRSGEASDSVAETAEETLKVMAALLEGVPVDAAERSEGEQARWLMAQLLEWHRREEKAAWWEYFRLLELPLEDYEDERSALAGLTFVETVGGSPRKPIHRYAFPPQEHDVRRGDDVCVREINQPIGKIDALDVAGHTVDIEQPSRHADTRPERVFVRRMVSPKPKPAVLLEIGRFIAASGADADGPHRAARDLLLRRPPRLVSGSRGLLPAERQASTAPGRVIAFAAARSAVERQRAAAATPRAIEVDAEVKEAIRLGFELDHGVLPIQGPPGTGKTFTGSHMILELIKAKKKVGVTAVGHETIRNVLRAVCRRAEEQGLEGFKCLHKGKPKDDNPEALHAYDDNDRVAELLRGGEYSLLGGTSWLWANARFRDSVDVLFIDEAGQMSLADVLAVSAGAKSLVLLGDPQQLEQPQQASHPPGAGASALEHLLGGTKTIAPERGLFLHQTRRLHPEICKFTALAFYENRLTSFAGLERQAVLSPPGSAAAKLGSSGLVYVPVEHDANQSRSLEEVAAIESLVDALTAFGVRYRNAAGEEVPLTRDDIMIVAPYNAQVTALAERLPDVRIGTVDKFQGREAPVVIVSLTTSAPEDAPRGMDFLYSANRLNVATSRAKALCILVGNPRLFEPDCRTPQQMRLANAFCLYRENARLV
ncbi:MAG TPA: TM0106 family RecB-like putative nuclease [Gammaproteobacteria bacterium]|nr:TM0106 family RecB-like putative nuclease [Gammaproteobacteria bacterium]